MSIQIQSPFMITARLMVGFQLGDATVSVSYDGVDDEGRDAYDVVIDFADGESFDVGPVRTGVGGGSIGEAMESLLAFLGAAAEAGNADREDPDSNANLFPARVVEWAEQNSDELAMMETELQENPDLISED